VVRGTAVPETNMGCFVLGKPDNQRFNVNNELQPLCNRSFVTPLCVDGNIHAASFEMMLLFPSPPNGKRMMTTITRLQIS
jgi:hypothetical protein